jgi:cytochrome c-type biogenesis protein CcmE
VTAARRPAAFAAAVAVFVLALAYLVYGGIQQGATYWVTVGELRQRTGAGAVTRVRLGGTVQPGTVAWDRTHRHLRFAVTDGRDAIRVEYTGVVPDIFAEGRQVVVEGALRPDGIFAASTLLAKCPTKYNPSEAQAAR